MARSVKALITPEILKWARERRIKLEIDYAAKKLKIDPECLEAWEDGTEQPTIAQLKKIAKLYKTHISIFYLSEPPTDFQPLTDYRVLPEQLTTDAEQIYRLNANIIEAFERREVLIELYELLEEVPTEVTLNINRHENPEQVAKKITEFLEPNRTLLRAANDPYAALKFWKHTVEAKGILVCQISVNTHLSVELTTARGFCIAQRPFPIIVVNPKDNPYGRIFTLIHELVHIALGESAIQNTGFEAANSANLDPIEIFCNQVAAEILVPENELLEKVNVETLQEDLPGISKFFHVSSEVIMRRLQTLGVISRRDYQTYRSRQLAKYRDLPERGGGSAPYHHRLLNTSGEHFARIAFTAYYEQKITRAELASVLSNSDTKHLAKIESAIFV